MSRKSADRNSDRAPDSRSIERLLYRGFPSFRRRILGATAGAVLLLSGISVALAWHQYDDAKSRAVSDLEARVVAVSAVVDSSFAGQIETLDSIAQAPSVRGEQFSRMDAYFKQINSGRSVLFSGGIGWINHAGVEHASAAANGLRPPSTSRRVRTFAGCSRPPNPL